MLGDAPKNMGVPGLYRCSSWGDTTNCPSQCWKKGIDHAGTSRVDRQVGDRMDLWFKNRERRDCKSGCTWMVFLSGLGILFIPSDRPKSPRIFRRFFLKKVVSKNSREKLGSCPLYIYIILYIWSYIYIIPCFFYIHPYIILYIWSVVSVFFFFAHRFQAPPRDMSSVQNPLLIPLLVGLERDPSIGLWTI